MSWRVVHIKQSEIMRLKLDNLYIKKQYNEYMIPLSDISMLIIEGGETVVTVRLLSALAKYNIVVIICDEQYLPIGFYHPLNHHHKASKRTFKQMEWPLELKDVVWQQIVYYKLTNQSIVLQTLQKDPTAISLINSYLPAIQLGDQTNREGHAAKVYFNALFGKTFTRKTQQENVDLYNAGLNYGYAILRGQMARIVCGYGLQPVLGVFHKNEYNHFNLVDDLMEPFRPIVDLWVRERLETEMYLSYQLRLELIDILNATIRYGNQTCTVTMAMDKYVKGFIRYMDKGDTSKFFCPEVATVEWSELK